MLCPLKFSHYEFEGGQDCIGSECGMHKLCGANDTLAAENDVSAASVDANVGNAMQDSREKLEADVREFWFPYNGMSSVYSKENVDRVLGWLDRQSAITERDLCKQCSWPSLAAMPDKEAYDRIAELQEQVDNLTKELTAAYNALACSEHDNATLREKLGRMLDCSHEITRIGGDC